MLLIPLLFYSFLELDPAKPQPQDEGWEQIRLNIDTDYFNGYKMDSIQCQNAGQSVQWRYPAICRQEDVLSQERKDALTQTLKNVEKFLTKLLKVKPYDQPIERKVPLAWYIKVQEIGFRTWNNYQIFYPPLPFTYDEKPIEGLDLYVPVLVRPYPVKQGVPVTHETFVVDNTSSYRPLLASLIIDASNTPSQAEDENSENPYYFNIYLREMIRILGFESDYFDHFHPYENNDPHTQIFCTFTKDQFSHKLLVTPFAKQWAQRHFGIQTIESCPVGIEIEGNGLSSRMFFTEIMAASNLLPSNGKFLRLTGATLAVLQDTGNYKCDWQLAQPLLWGHKESIDDKYITDFTTKGPAIYNADIPKGATFATSFDYKYYGKVMKFSDKTNSYVNPDSVYCPAGQALLPSNWNQASFGLLKCGEFQCWGFDSFNIKVLNNSDENTFQTVECTNDTIGQTFAIPLAHGTETTTRNVTCPNPERFCRTMRLYEEHYPHDPLDITHSFVDMLPHPTPTPMPSPSPSPSPSKSIEPTKSALPPPTSSPKPPAPTKSPNPSPKPTPTPEPTVIPRTMYIIPSLGKISLIEPPAAAKGGSASNNNDGASKKNYSFIFIIVGVLAVVAIIEVTFVGIRYRKKLQKEAYKDEEDAAVDV